MTDTPSDAAPPVWGQDDTDRSRFHTIQPLIRPDQRLNDERLLYLRGTGADFDTDGTLALTAQAAVRFDTYFNLFSIGKWRRYCDLSDLHLALWGQGEVVVTIGQHLPDSAPQTLSDTTLTLSGDSAATRIDLCHIARAHEGPGVLWFGLTATGGSARVVQAAWQTRQPPVRVPDLTLSITTFRREAAVARSVARFRDFAATSDLAPHLHLVVVDNGQSADVTSDDHVTVFPNANLGGAGGFARGLIEARRRGSSHCLFMDDDAAVHMDSIDRTWRFLAWAQDPSVAVAGALSIAAHKWAIWENGALFESNCKPLHMGTDLRSADQTAALDFASTGAPAHNFYGGWWYFAFPVAHATHMPFPFFVRGDDISFGLAHEFNTVTLPGVMSFQDEDFADKESLQTLYLDLRGHLAHHLALPHMEIGRLRTLRIAWWFYARSAVQLHYDTLAALDLSFADALAGPDFFAAHADMSVRRADLAALRRDEAWKPIPDGAMPPKERRWINPDIWPMRWLIQLTLNGHLVPGFHLFGNRMVLTPGQRGQLHPCWGAAEITYWDSEAGRYFTVRHSKARFFGAVLGLLRNSVRFLRGYKALLADWRRGYGRLTTQSWWQATLGLDDKTP